MTEAKGNGAGFYGKPYQPGAIIKNDVEYVLLLQERRRIPIADSDAKGAVDVDEGRNEIMAPIGMV